MAFSEYKDFGQVQVEFNITLAEQDFILAEAVNPPDIFLREFEFIRENLPVFTSAGAPQPLSFRFYAKFTKITATNIVLWIHFFSYDAKLN